MTTSDGVSLIAVRILWSNRISHFLCFTVIDDEIFSISRFHPVFSKSNLKILTGQQYVINYEKGICMQAATSTC